MIMFQLPEEMTREELIRNHEEATDKWRNIGELIRKSYIYDADLGGGGYHWKSVAAADEWHGTDWCRFEVPIVADNEQDKAITF